MATRKFVRLGAFVAAISMAFTLIAAPLSWAKPTSPFPFTVRQPDGTTLELYRRGDEFRNWIENAEGYTVIKNEATGYWEFAATEGGRIEKHRRSEIGSAFRKAQSAARRVWAPRTEPLEGKYNLLLILVGFDDFELRFEEVHAAMAFGDSDSVKEYYLDQSRGKLEIVPALEGRGAITVKLAEHPFPDGYDAAYDEDEEKAHKHEVKFVTETLKAALAEAGKNLYDFDADNDGYVTPDELCVYMIVAGYEESAAVDIPAVWAHAAGSLEEYGPEYVVMIDDVILTDWAMQGELIEENTPQQIGTMAHELGHQLCRLPDLYAVSYTNEGLGSFSLMDGGCNGMAEGGIQGSSPVNMDAWSRQYLGWEKPGLPGDGPVTFYTPGQGTGSVKLLRGGQWTTEYFLAEVRDFSGWDKGLKGLFLEALIRELDEPEILPEHVLEILGFLEDFKGGLLILHVDEAIGSGNLDEGNDINDAEENPHQGVMAVDARNPNPHQRGERSTPYTLWWGENPEIDESAREQSGASGRTVDFKPPASNFYNGVGTGISITGIGGVENGTITATINAAQPGKSGGGCDVGAGYGLVALALIVFFVFRRHYSST